MPSALRRPIALVGLMGSGKSTVARLLGERLAVSTADLDAMLEAEEGGALPEIFTRRGEPWFRKREGQLLRAALTSGAQVVACGGGIVLDPANRAVLRERCDAVWLEVSAREGARRLEGESSMRPLLAGKETEPALARLLEERGQAYAEVARARIETDGRTPDQVADQVLAALEAVAR
jgi:shikimate kinase